MSPASYLTAPPRVAAASVARSRRFLVWLAAHAEALDPEREQRVDEHVAALDGLDLGAPDQVAKRLLCARFVEIEPLEHPLTVWRSAAGDDGAERLLLGDAESLPARLELRLHLEQRAFESGRPVRSRRALAGRHLLPEPVREEHRPLRVPLRGREQRRQPFAWIALGAAEAIDDVRGDVAVVQPTEAHRHRLTVERALLLLEKPPH